MLKLTLLTMVGSMSKYKTKMLAVIVTLSFPTMVFFQNCSQQGSLQVSGGEVAAAGLTAGSDIPKDPVDDGGMVIVPPPTAPPAAQPPVAVQPPVTMPPVVHPPSANPPGKLPENDDDEDHHHGGAVVSHGDGHEGGSCDDHEHDSDQQAPDCRHIQISDIRLNIESVGLEASCQGHDDNRSPAGGRVQPEFEVVDQNSTITLLKPVLKIRALKNLEIKDLFVRLSASGNQILSSNNVAMDLVTPSAQQSGLKFKLARAVKIEAGKRYDLRFEIHPEDQIVANPTKCIMKPVIKSATLVPSN